jgi:hypothetical protein
MAGMPVRRARREAEAEARARDEAVARATTLDEAVATFSLKRCSKCGEVKPLTEFYKAKHNWRGDGRRSACKACRYVRLPTADEIRASEMRMRPYLAEDFEYDADQTDDEERVAASADPRPRTKPPPPATEAQPSPHTYPTVEPKPPPSPNPTGMPQYLRDDASRKPAPTEREAAVARLGEMTWAERQEETRVARIYPRTEGPNQIPGEPRYMREAR